MSRLVFLDTETTSLDDTRGEVWEIGAIERRLDGDHEWLWQIAPTRMEAADPNSLRVCGFYERFDTETRELGAARIAAPGARTEGPMPVGGAALELALMLNGAHVVGAVPDFDYRFLRRFLAANGQCWAAHYHLIDVEALAVGYLAGQAAAVRMGIDESASEPLLALPWKSTELYRAVGVDPDKYEAHTALGDARLVRDVYDAVTGGGC